MLWRSPRTACESPCWPDRQADVLCVSTRLYRYVTSREDLTLLASATGKGQHAKRTEGRVGPPFGTAKTIDSSSRNGTYICRKCTTRMQHAVVLATGSVRTIARVPCCHVHGRPVRAPAAASSVAQPPACRSFVYDCAVCGVLAEVYRRQGVVRHCVRWLALGPGRPRQGGLSVPVRCANDMPSAAHTTFALNMWAHEGARPC